jgi:tetratricopeptide (TPR) repeat protein
MGNLHMVTQIAPYRSWVGAALPIRPGREDAVRLALVSLRPPYSAVEQAVRRATAPGGQTLSWPSGRWHLTVRSGGKWGWDDLRPFLEHVAADLSDARFFLDDEYVGFVDEYRVCDGRLDVRRVVPGGGSAAGYLMTEVAECAGFAFDRLAESLDEFDLSVGDRETAAMRDRFPDRWPTLAAQAVAAAERERWTEAVAAFRAALAELARVGEPAPAHLLGRYVEVLRRVDPVAALEVARQAAPLWHADAPWSLALLADLEERDGRREQAAEALAGSLRPRYPQLTPHDQLYAGARVLALAGDLDAARDWLRVATMVDPSVAGRAAVEPDLAPLGYPPPPAVAGAPADSVADDPADSEPDDAGRATPVSYGALDALLDDGRIDDAVQFVGDGDELGAALHLVGRVAGTDADRLEVALTAVPPRPAAVAPLMRLAARLDAGAGRLAVYRRILAFDLPTGGVARTLYLRAANNACVTAHLIGDLALAVRLADAAQPYAAENPHIYHSAACVYALTGDHDRALEQVALAVATGYEHLDLLADDDDLAAIRDRPEFRRLVRRPD